MNAQTIAATLAENPQVLLVDDDSLIRESLAFVLGESFDVLMAGTRDEALGMVRSSSSVPSLALLTWVCHLRRTRPMKGLPLWESLCD